MTSAELCEFALYAAIVTGSADQWPQYKAQLTAVKRLIAIFVGCKCDLDWNVGLVRSRHATAAYTQSSLLLLQSHLATEQ